MTQEKFYIGMPVVYFPLHKKNTEPIEDNQLGIVTSKNDRFIFVKYLTSNCSQATNPNDLFSIDNRPDLQERLGIEIKPTTRINELYLNSRI